MPFRNQFIDFLAKRQPLRPIMILKGIGWSHLLAELYEVPAILVPPSPPLEPSIHDEQEKEQFKQGPRWVVTVTTLDVSPYHAASRQVGKPVQERVRPRQICVDIVPRPGNAAMPKSREVHARRWHSPCNIHCTCNWTTCNWT